MTWATYKKKFSPEIWYVPDFIGSRTVVKPTMTNAGFNNVELYDIDPNEKPTEIVLRECNSLSKYIDVNFPVVYHKWTYRDFSGYAITMFYKNRNQ